MKLTQEQQKMASAPPEKSARKKYRYSDTNTYTDNLTLKEAQDFQRRQNGGTITPMPEAAQ